ncbi:DUF6705 family protein [Elizabethkingia anophelis]|uniref:DUF6705 family protein n=1 Tax=Elizabethkingia anophelis TaxID=1117645 RepID=UPI000C6DDE05|nr:DUF6705 family protein [Elizabethkingia anophelis]MCT4297343.1 hypothetical protein [Elizabethkingia anophelis]MCT4300891.1 hypothetical protein [Elizabethkingia anophelis]PKR30822.1 hypothetical protein CWH99_08430 [Elizabethkingia anophelis]PKR35962.1 hypothetical protein CWI00_02155 [Elizabethkingia anophelis]PRQ80000.1 hypothetical protein CMT60_07170 [Elizabethkingia anophelis]
MKKLIFSIVIIFFGSYINAQTISLSQVPNQTPIGSYLKDIDNTLPLFTGTWTANFKGKQIMLNISDKVENHPIQLATTNYYRDVVFMRYTIKDVNGNNLASTMNKTIINANIISTFTSPDKTRIGFYYYGEECGIGNGTIMLTRIDETHFKWEYNSLRGIIDPTQCSDYSPNIKSYIPRAVDLTFTKQ